MLWNHRLLIVGLSGAILLSAGLLFSFRLHRSQARAEQYAVYSSYIEDGLTGVSHSFGDPRGLVLIGNDTSLTSELSAVRRWLMTAESLLNLRRRTGHPRLSLIYGLFAANLGTHRFERRFSISADYKLVELADLSKPTNRLFSHSYGYLTFSSIAFNPDLTEALFYAVHLCGLCGGSEYVLMRKAHGTWFVVNRYSTGVS
jgi:hypothetical protein